MARVPVHPAKLARVDAALREMFEALAAQPVPSRLLSVAEQLEDLEDADRKSGRRKGKQG